MLWELIFDLAATATLHAADKNRVPKQQRLKEEFDRNDRIKSFEEEYGRIPLFFGQKKYWDRVNRIRDEKLRLMDEQKAQEQKNK